MNKISINVSRLLYDNVVASDVLKIYRSINNFSITSKEIINIENSLIINSFSKHKSLFNSRYIYYKLSNVLKDMELFIDKEKFEKVFDNLVIQTSSYIVSDIDDFSKIRGINDVCFKYFYSNYINEPVIGEDILNVHRGISLNNSAVSAIILLEKRFLAGAINNSQVISSNKLVYYKLARQIKEIGIKVRKEKKANDVFNKLFVYTNSILNIDNIDLYTKLNILDFLYFKFSELEFNIDKNYYQQLNTLNNELKGLLKNLPKKLENKKECEKKLVLEAKACLA